MTPQLAVAIGALLGAVTAVLVSAYTIVTKPLLISNESGNKRPGNGPKSRDGGHGNPLESTHRLAAD